MRECHSRGFVLIETLVALAVLSIGIIGVNRALQESLVARAQARDYTQARFLLEQVMSELEMQPQLVEEGRSGDFGAEFPMFRWEWQVTKVPLPVPPLPALTSERLRGMLEPPAPYLGKIRVTVRWTRARREFAETVETLVGKDKLYVPKEAKQPSPGA